MPYRVTIKPATLTVALKLSATGVRSPIGKGSVVTNMKRLAVIAAIPHHGRAPVCEFVCSTVPGVTASVIAPSPPGRMRRWADGWTG